MKVLLIILSFLMVNLSYAQVALYEQEPNNEPLTGNSFTAPIKILGNLQGRDQDMFIWNVTDADAGYLWDVGLDGLPERLTRVDFMHLTFTEDGKGVTKVDKLFSISNHGGTTTVKKSGLVISPGKYYIGLSYAGGGNSDSGSSLFGDSMLSSLGEEYVADNNKIDSIKVIGQIAYQLKIVKGKKLYTLKSENNSKDNPGYLRENTLKSLYFETKNKWVNFNFSEKDAKKVWKISGNVVVGGKLKLNFYDSNGELKTTTKSNLYGHFVLPDLKLPEGDYLLELVSHENAVSSIIITDSGESIEGQESEPNDYFKGANHIVIGQSISGQMGKTNEYDYFKFDISEEMSQNQLEIKLTNSEDTKLDICLYNDKKVQMQCKSKKGDIALTQLVLSSGTYGVSVARGKINTQYTLDIINKGKIKSIMEAEPNDKFVFATAMNAKRIIRGKISGKEIDFFKFEVGEEPQMWTVQAVGNSITNLSLYNAAGDKVQEQRFVKGTNRVRLSNLQLMPGKHVVRVHGEESKYLLRVFPTGPVDKSFEVEPNDKKKQAMKLEFKQKKKGLLQNLTDRDLYRFHLNNEQGIHLSIQPPTDGGIQYHLEWEGMRIGKKISKVGQKLEYIGVLPAGDYDLLLNAKESVSDDIYQLELNHYEGENCVHDCEPNDTVYQANLIQAPMNVLGKSGTHEDYDWYKLPAFATETTVTFQNNASKDNYSTKAYIDYNKNIRPVLDKEKKQTSFVIPANKESYYMFSYVETIYDFTVLIDNKEQETPEDYKDVKMSIQNMASKVKAYSSKAQTLNAQLLIENTGSKTQPLTFQGKSNDYRWQIIIDKDSHKNSYEILPGQKINLPIMVKVPINAPKNQHVRIRFFAYNKEKLISKTWQDVEIDADTALVQPSDYWEIDESLLGGVNVAATAMGGIRTKEDLAFNINAIGTDFEKLFDGFTANGLGMQYRGGRKSEQDFITIELAGNKLIDVKGLLLNPLSKVKPNLYLKDFDFQLSTDGINFQSVLKGQVNSVSAEQSFVLEEIVPARFARLYLLSSHEGREKSNTGLGEWKVIASPKQVISDNDGFNIADPKFGGYVAWAKPESSGQWDINILTEKQEKRYAKSVTSDDWQWVVGFHNQRAAKINKIQWYPAQVDISKKAHISEFKKVKILVSTNSNVGPWKLVAENQLSASGNTDEIILDQAVWARFVKFSVSDVKARTSVYFPETIKIFEQKADEKYYSILGEWGELSENAIYEKLNPPNFKQTMDDKNNNSKDKAIDLTQKHTATGQVQLEMADKPDWYKYKPKAGENTLNISLSGKQTVETVFIVEDNQGKEVPLIKVKNDTNKAQYQAQISANLEYYVKVEEPPRSVIFAWDTSGSTQAYEPMIYDALSSYTNDVIVGRDTVNFLPFGGGLLMKDWYGQPYYLKTILNNYSRLDDSSAAEKTLLNASKALENRQGSKSIIIITDAITGKHAAMWDSLRKVHPRIFSLGIIGNGFGGNPNRQIDLMQSWSRVNNGDFQKVVTAAEVELAFERVATKLRQPADYTLTMSSEFIKIPGPGQLLITQDLSAQSNAVELILDASGSMLKRLNGKRRINIAKEVLIKAVTEIIPAKTPLALRVFGDKQANSCRTDLAIKLKPLDPNSAKKVIEKIYAKNLAKTPIAASLAKVASDLKAHKGKKIVILVTDGEETCDGNPEEVIEKLLNDGIDIRLNIVGFAIDDEALKAQFNQWSTQGGGKYFDSNNPESLKDSVTQALKTPYSVFSQSGELIKEGTVNGEPLVLPAGYYTIKVYDSEIKTYDNYKIKGESKQTIEL